MCFQGEKKVEDPKTGEDLPEMELHRPENVGSILCFGVRR